MISVTCNDSKLLTVFAQSIKLVCKCCLELLARDVGQLGLSDKRLGLCTDKFLFEDNNTRTVGLLVLELRNLVGNLLLACRTNK